MASSIKERNPMLDGFGLIAFASLFERLNLSRAPVIDNGKLVGVVSLTRMVLHGIRK